MVERVQYCEWGNGQQDGIRFVSSIEHIKNGVSYSGYKHRINGEIDSGKDGFYYEKQNIIREIHKDCK